MILTLLLSSFGESLIQVFLQNEFENGFLGIPFEPCEIPFERARSNGLGSVRTDLGIFLFPQIRLNDFSSRSNVYTIPFETMENSLLTSIERTVTRSFERIKIRSNVDVRTEFYPFERGRSNGS